MSVKIITDSASDMTQLQAAERNLTVIPLTIRMDGEEYLDGVTLTKEAFYCRLPDCAALPTTSQIAPYAFTEVLNRELKEGDEAVIITISGKLSGTVQSALIAASEFDGRVQVVDSRNVCVGEQVLVEYALRLRDQGMGATAIAEQLQAMREQICLVALVDTLEYVIKGGRLSKAAGFAGTMLNVRPVVGVKDGELKVLGKALGAKKSNNLLTQTIHATGGIDFSLPLMLGYSGADDTKLQDYIENSRALWEANVRESELPISMIGSTVGTYAGPGAVAIAYFARQPL